MKSLSLALVLLALLSGCTIHEPVYQIVYTPDKHLTNNAVDDFVPVAGYTVPVAAHASGGQATR